MLTTIITNSFINTIMFFAITIIVILMAYIMHAIITKEPLYEEIHDSDEDCPHGCGDFLHDEDCPMLCDNEYMKEVHAAIKPSTFDPSLYDDNGEFVGSNTVCVQCGCEMRFEDGDLLNDKCAYCKGS